MEGNQEGTQTEDAQVKPRSESRVHLSRHESFHAWVGRRERLIRLEAELVRLLEAERTRLLEALQPVNDGFEEDIRVRVKRERLAEDLELKVEVTAAKGRLRRSGTMAAILDEMDSTEIETIAMSNGWAPLAAERGYPTVCVRFGEKSESLFGDKPISIDVAGPDRQWVGGTFDYLVSEIRKDVPWWAAFRTYWAGIVLGLALGAAFFGWRFAGSPDHDQQDLGLVVNFALVVVFGAVLNGVFTLRPLLRRMFPALEVVDAGVIPRGRQALAAVVGLVTFGMAVAGLALALVPS